MTPEGKTYWVLAHLSKSNSRTFQGLSRTNQSINPSLYFAMKHVQVSNNKANQYGWTTRPYERYIRRTKLNQTSTFISIYKQVQFTFDNLTPASINQKLELSEKFT